MAFSMLLVRSIAHRFGVDPGDDAAVTEFLYATLPFLNRDVQRRIESELLSGSSRSDELMPYVKARDSKAHDSSVPLDQTAFRQSISGELDRNAEVAGSRGVPVAVYVIDADRSLEAQHGLEGAGVIRQVVMDVVHHNMRSYDVMGLLGPYSFGVLVPLVPRSNEAVEEGTRRVAQETVSYCAWSIADRLLEMLQSRLHRTGSEYRAGASAFAIGFETALVGEDIDQDRLLDHAKRAATIAARDTARPVAYYRGPLSKPATPSSGRPPRAR